MADRQLASRRRLLGALVAGCAGATWAHSVHPTRSDEPPTGWLLPRQSAPDRTLTRADGTQLRLSALLTGHVTGVQLMFTGCSSTCPPQGLLFAEMARRTRSRGVAWLSLSIDALGDDAARLKAWLQRHGSPPGWQAAVPGVADVDELNRFVRGVPVRPGTHTNQVFLFDRAGRLAYRTGDNPSIPQLEQLLAAV